MGEDIEVRKIQFSSQHTARAVIVREKADPHSLLSALDFDLPRALVVITGGAGGMDLSVTRAVRPLLVDGLARLSNQRVAILDGGTASGVMKLIGEGAAQHGLGAPLIGVCPAAKVAWPGNSNPEAVTSLEPHHSHFVLTPGEEFGTESSVIYTLAGALDEWVPSVALLINGGSITYEEAFINAKQGREIVVFEGSGRAADAIAAAVRGKQFEEKHRIADIVGRGEITLFDVESEPAELLKLLQRRLQMEGQSESR